MRAATVATPVIVNLLALTLKSTHAFALVLVAAATVVTESTEARPAEQRVLLVTEARGFVHESIRDAEAFFAGLGRRSSRYDVIQLSAAAELTHARLRRADAVVFANTTGELPLPSRRGFLRFVRRGGGFVGTHSASDTLHSWPAYARLLGGEFVRHGRVQPGRVLLSRPGHPVTRDLPRSFRLTDEFYEFATPRPEGSRVVLRLDPGSVADEMQQDLPVAWARPFGRGRVFYNALGHRPETWRDPRFRLVVKRGLRWVLGL